jgi:AcrR family transcriptional regulator
MSPPAAAVQRPKRADAVRNRELVVDAAAAVFAERGMDTSVEQVAERAGVGRATVYRSFPTKEHLLAGVAVQRLQQISQLAHDALADADAGAAFRRVLGRIAELQSADRVMLDALRMEADIPELADARADTHAAIAALVDRAKSQGRLRADATAMDVRVLLSGIAHAMPAKQRRDATAWRRYAGLVADALEA